MSELQRRGISESDYERPSQTWVCGWTAAGRPCPRGPDARGACQTTSECTPTRRGDRWICSRTPGFGGACEAGPRPDGSCACPVAPCQPTRSLRARRRALVWGSTAGTLGLVCLALAGSSWRSVLSPGDLSTAHATSTSDCSTCHPQVHEGGLALLDAAFQSRPITADGDACLACHSLGEAAHRVHGLPDERLRRVTERLREGEPSTRPLLRLAGAWGAPTGPSGEIACASCHSEHQGRGADITRLGGDRCQVCHVRQFASFASGHPEFRDFPYERRTRLRFRHGSHRAKHFPNQKRDWSCIGCHALEGSGRYMEVLPFEQSCGSCHADDVHAGKLRAGQKGIPVLRLPAIDRAAIETEGVPPIGDWAEPKRRSRSKKKEIADPFVDLLLLGGRDLSAEELTRVHETGLVPRKPSIEQRRLLVRYAWAVKGLLHDLRRGGHELFRERVESAIGRELRASELAGIEGQLPRAVLTRALERWLPNLEAEVKLYRGLTAAGAEVDPAALVAGLAALPEPVPAPERDLSDRREEGWAVAGGWFESEGDRSIRYRPAGHEDRFLQAWTELSLALRPTTDEPTDDPRDRTPAERLGQSLFDAFTKSKSPGRCLKCHSVEGAGELRVAWTAYRPSPEQHPPTRFAHRPHMSIALGEGCATCHDDAEPVDPDAGYDGFAPHVGYASDFEAMSRETCVGCHSGGVATDECTSCHSYHRGDFRALHLTE